MPQRNRYVNVISQIQDRARFSPSSVAVQCNNISVSFGELERRSTAVAAAIIEKGIKPRDCVGLFAGRSPELIVGLLGILKAGALYLPLDPNYPKSRNSFSVAETNCKLALTGQSIESPADIGTELLSISEAEGEFRNAMPLAGPSAGSDEPAYIIYTSGSTGRPNGVLGLNGPLANYIRWLRGHIAVTSRDRVLNISSISFDPSLRDILVPLSAGAALVILPQADAKNALAYIECIRKQQVTKLLSITPTLLRRLCALDEPAGESLKAILTCGEPLPYGLAHLARMKFGPSTKIFNMYGPTECTMTTTVFEVENDVAGKQGLVPIGFPRDGTEVYLLGDDGREVPDGAIGEIHIGGSGLAGGYLNRPELMRQRFIRWSHAPGSSPLLFKTGDFGRRSVDGVLMFEGRIDDQVKIRGERIEIGEIEAAVAGLADEVGVVVLPEGAYAFAVAGSRQENIKQQVLAACRDKLSAVAVPREVFLLEGLPHTPSGKIDRKILRDYVLLWKARQTYVSPVTGLEKKIALIWKEILVTSEFGIDTDFVAAGGDSMHAASIANRLSSLLALDIPSYLIIEAMTIRNLAAIIESANQASVV